MLVLSSLTAWKLYELVCLRPFYRSAGFTHYATRRQISVHSRDTSFRTGRLVYNTPSQHATSRLRVPHHTSAAAAAAAVFRASAQATSENCNAFLQHGRQHMTSNSKNGSLPKLALHFRAPMHKTLICPISHTLKLTSKFVT